MKSIWEISLLPGRRDICAFYEKDHSEDGSDRGGQVAFRAAQPSGG